MQLPSFLKALFFLFTLLTAFGQENEEVKKTAHYRLKAGDTIQLSVFREEDLEKKVTLTHTGGAAFRFIGTLQLAGLTLEEARKKIAAAYDDGWLVEPEVTLDLIAAADEIVTVMGAVEKPGDFVIPKGEGFGLDLASALSKAGGPSSNADLRKITVKRNKQQQTYHYASITSESAQAIQLIHGDIIDVGINPNVGAIVSVIGEVKTPGPVAFQPNIDVQIALGSRGGPTEKAGSGYWIKRGDSRISASLNTKMQPGDVLTIPVNGLVGKKVVVSGEVNRPSDIPFNLNGKMTLLEAITNAGGEKPTGNISKITILRNQKAYRANLTDMKDGKERMFQLEPGDSISVPQRSW